jgi:hypothetical protein
MRPAGQRLPARQLVELLEILELPALHQHLALQRHPQQGILREADERAVGGLGCGKDQPFTYWVARAVSVRFMYVTIDGGQRLRYLTKDLVFAHHFDLLHRRLLRLVDGNGRLERLSLTDENPVRIGQRGLGADAGGCRADLPSGRHSQGRVSAQTARCRRAACGGQGL